MTRWLSVLLMMAVTALPAVAGAGDAGADPPGYGGLELFLGCFALFLFVLTWGSIGIAVLAFRRLTYRSDQPPPPPTTFPHRWQPLPPEKP